MVTHDDFPVSEVPREARRPARTIAVNMMGGPICVAALAAGAGLAQGLSLLEVLSAVLIGCTLLVLFGGAIGMIGFRRGLATSVLLRSAFGRGGSGLVTLVIASCLVGWFAVQTSLFGETVQAIFPNGGWLVSAKVATIWGGLLMLTTALYGFYGLTILSRVAVPLLLVLCAWGVGALVDWGKALSYVPAQPGSIGKAVTMIFGALAVGATTTSDVTRFCRRSRDVWLTCGLSYGLTNILMLLSGAAIAASAGSGDLIASMVAIGLGVPALLILVLGQWTTNDDNLYSASLGVTAVVPRVSKKVVVFVLGIVATAVAAVGASAYLPQYLVMLGVCIPPFGGVLLAEALRQARLEASGDAASVHRDAAPVVALLACALGAAVGFGVQIGIPALNSIGVAFLVYYVGRAIFRR